MNVRLRGSRPGPGEPAGAGRAFAEAAEAARALEALGHETPTVLAVHPVAQLNPFQALLYQGAWQAGVAPIPLHDIADLEGLESLPGLGVRTVLHLHWTNKVLEGARDEADARQRMDSFIGRLDRFRAAGGRLVWTVHNEVPHDAREPELEEALQAAIVARADVVHVMHPATLAAAASRFPIPADRALLVPHPSYAGAYPDLVSRDAARYRLGLDPDAVVYGLFGAIKPYKGLRLVLDAFDAAVAADPPGAPPRHLLVAGGPDRASETQHFLERARLHPGVTLDARRVPAEELAGHLRATDVAILPYDGALNSGVLLLALTFGLPVVVPDLPGFDGLTPPELARRYPVGDPNGLADALRDADRFLTPTGRAAASASAATIVAERRPGAVSAAFFGGLLERLG